jgi:hypothetical protein
MNGADADRADTLKVIVAETLPSLEQDVSDGDGVGEQRSSLAD